MSRWRQKRSRNNPCYVSVKKFIREVAFWVKYLKEEEKMVAEKILLKIITLESFETEAWLLMNQVFQYLERQSGLAYGNDMFK